MKKLNLFILLGMMVASLAFAGGNKEAASGEKEADMSFFASITAVEPIVAAYGEENGVNATYTRLSTSSFVSTILTEHQAGKLSADVIQAPVPILQILKENGVIENYTSPAAKDYPDWTKDDGIQLFGIEAVALIYNTDLVSAEEAPKTYQELTDPKWNNKIVMSDPSNHATTISWLVGLKENVFATEAEWEAFLKGLAANNPMFVKSFGSTPGPLETGEKAIGISLPKYIVTKAPAPLDWARVSQPLMGSARGIAIAAKATNPTNAKSFLDYWLSANTMGTLASDVGEYVLTPGVYPPINGMEDAEVIAIRELSDDEIEMYGEKFKEIFF